MGFKLSWDLNRFNLPLCDPYWYFGLEVRSVLNIIQLRARARARGRPRLRKGRARL